MRTGRPMWLVAGVVACTPATSRPSFPPVPQAATTEVRLPPREATRLLAEALEADSIPVARVDLRDSWLETVWFDRSSGRRTQRRPVGENVVRVRAWADPTHPGNSKLIVETLYHPSVDPSLPERELDRQVPRDHSVAVKVRGMLQNLVKRYGGPPAPAPPPAERAEPDPTRAGPEDEAEGPTPDEE